MASKPIAFVACPTCGWNRVIRRKGTNAMNTGKAITHKKGIFRFGQMDLQGFDIVRLYVSHGRNRTGIGPSGFEKTEGLTLDQMLSDPDWQWVVDDLYAQAKDIVDRVESAKGE